MCLMQLLADFSPQKKHNARGGSQHAEVNHVQIYSTFLTDSLFTSLSDLLFDQLSIHSIFCHLAFSILRSPFWDPLAHQTHSTQVHLNSVSKFSSAASLSQQHIPSKQRPLDLRDVLRPRPNPVALPHSPLLVQALPSNLTTFTLTLIKGRIEKERRNKNSPCAIFSERGITK